MERFATAVERHVPSLAEGYARMAAARGATLAPDAALDRARTVCLDALRGWIAGLY